MPCTTSSSCKAIIHRNLTWQTGTTKFIHLPFDKKLTLVSVFYNMQREAPRTLHTMASAYQNLSEKAYDVIVIDNHSSEPLDERMVKSFGSNFHYHYFGQANSSPVFAINYGLSLAESDKVAIHIDGARLLSPGILGQMIEQLDLYEQGLVYTIGFHLGSNLQKISALDGYDQEQEDQLLESVNWKKDGYQLFDISVLAGTNSGYFNRAQESNLFALNRPLFEKVGGYDERFVSQGGGLCNLEIFSRYVAHEDVLPIVLVGEGTFRQFDSSVLASAHEQAKQLTEFKNEYFELFGYNFFSQDYKPFLHGREENKTKVNADFLATQALEVLLILSKQNDANLISKYVSSLSEYWPNNYQFSLRCARICKKHELYDLSKKLFHQCLASRDNDKHSILADLASIDYLEGNKEKAAKALRQVLNESPRNKEALRGLAKIKKSEKSFEEAIRILKNQIKYNHPKRSFVDHINISTSLKKAEDYNAAKMHLFFVAVWSKERALSVQNHLALNYFENKNFVYSNYYFKKVIRLQENAKPAKYVSLIKGLSSDGKTLQTPFYFNTYEGELGKSSTLLRNYVVDNSDSKVLKELLAKKEEIERKSSIICVLGMHRSGTSCLTGALQDAGLQSSFALDWNYDNLKGNREEIDVISLNHILLEHNDQSWHAIDQNAELSWTAEHAETRNELLEKRFATQDAWIFKDPRTVFTLDFWNDSQLPFTYIASYRHPMKSALSLFIRNGIPLTKGINLWITYNQRLLSLMDKYDIKLVCFDSEKTSYKKQLDEVIDHIEQDVTLAAPLDKAVAHEFYDDSLESSNYNLDFRALAKLNNNKYILGKAMELYDQLLDKTKHVSIQKNDVDLEEQALVESLIKIASIAKKKRRAEAYLDLLKKSNNNKIVVNRLLKLAASHKIEIPEELLSTFEASKHAETQLALLAYYKKFDVSKAWSHFSATKELFPEFVELIKMGGDIAYQLKDMESSKQFYAEVSEARPLDFKSAIRLYEIAIEEEDVEAEFKYIERAYRPSLQSEETGQKFFQSIVKHNRFKTLTAHLSAFESDQKLKFKDWFQLAEHLLNKHEADLLVAVMPILADRIEDKNHETRYHRLRCRASRHFFPNWYSAELLY